MYEKENHRILEAAYRDVAIGVCCGAVYSDLPCRVNEAAQDLFSDRICAAKLRAGGYLAGWNAAAQIYQDAVKDFSELLEI